MTRVSVSESLPSITEDDIAQVEQQLDLSLPEEYRAFLLIHNGGHPEPSVFPIKDNPSDSHGILEWFLCIQQGDYYDLRRRRELYSSRVPPDLLPIADDPGGNLICIAATGVNRGRVYFWSHEEEVEEGKIPHYDNVYFVAENFNQLLSSLTYLAGE